MFRTCDITGLKVDLQAQALIRANAVMAVVSLLITATVALLIGLTRWQVVHLLPADWYYRLLTAHGVNGLIFWIVFFEIAGLYFGSTIVVNSRMTAPWVGWLSFVLAVGGFLMTDYTIFTGQADVLFTSYVPLQAGALYYLGIILFALGALIPSFHFFANLWVAKREKTYEGSLPLFVFALVAAAIIAILTLLTGALILVPTLFWSLGIIKHISAPMYKFMFWGFGHSSQQINVTAMIGVWYLIARLTTGGSSISEKVSRLAFLMYIFFIDIAAAHHILTDPVFSPAWKVWNTGYGVYLAVLASFIHAFAVPSTMESAMRRKGYTKGLFDWFTNGPWGNPAFSACIISIFGFGFVGGITGVINGMEQTNTIIHNTLSLTGHIKGTLVSGTALAFMGLTWYLIPLIFRRKIVLMPLAKIQPFLFGLGIILVGISMYILGSFGIPRRHWDYTFSGGPFTYTFNPATDFFWLLFIIGVITAVTGALLFCIIVVLSVFFGPAVKGPADMQLAIASEPPEKEHYEGFEAPGTLTMSLFFMACFVAFLALNWGWLSAMWEVH